MRLHTFKDFFIISPSRESEDSSCLKITRKNGNMELISVDEMPNISEAFSLTIYGIIGMVDLLRGSYLIVISKAKKSTQIEGKIIYQITEVDIIPFAASKSQLNSQKEQDEKTYLYLLQNTFNSKSFHFSYDFDITNSRQRLNEINEKKKTR